MFMYFLLNKSREKLKEIFVFRSFLLFYKLIFPIYYISKQAFKLKIIMLQISLL